jgi:hypothetical protein
MIASNPIAECFPGQEVLICRNAFDPKSSGYHGSKAMASKDLISFDISQSISFDKGL